MGRRNARRRGGKVQQSWIDDAGKQRRLRLTDGAAWSAFAGRDSASGKVVSVETALQVSTVWACIRTTAQAIAGLPLQYFEKGRDGDRQRVDDELATILGESPNDEQTAAEFWEGMAAWLLTIGNAYAEIVSVGSRLIALHPIAGNRCQPVRRDDGALVYRVTDRGRTEDLPRDRVLHVRGFGFGGDLGLSPVRYGVQSMGAAIAGDEVSARLFGAGLSASGILTAEQVLDEEQRNSLGAIMQQYVGSERAGKLMILEGGLKYEALQLSPGDAQLLETRRFQVEDVCRWFGMPPIIIGHAAAGQTMWGTGIDAIRIAWLTLGIDPICDKIEARIKKQIVRRFGRPRGYAEFNREALMQMDSATKAAFLSAMVQNGLMDRNEGREKLNLPHRPGADRLTAQTNLAPLDQLGQAGAGNAARAAVLSWLGLDPTRKD
jgi:HK97 family phage portal protein